EASTEPATQTVNPGALNRRSEGAELLPEGRRQRRSAGGSIVSQTRGFIGQSDDLEGRDPLVAGRVGCRHGWGALNLGLHAIVRTARLAGPASVRFYRSIAMRKINARSHGSPAEVTKAGPEAESLFPPGF